MHIKKTKVFIFALFIVTVFVFYKLGFTEYLTFDYLKNNLSHIQSFVELNPLQAILVFFIVYVVAAAISFPGATILTLLAGALFGTFRGTIIVSFASSIGATFAFWASRFLFKDIVLKRFPTQINLINQNIQKEGAIYLFTLRLIPVFPFFMVNLLMGITAIRTSLYFGISLIGMLPGTIIYVFAGRRFSEITSLRGILSPQIIILLVLLGIFPYLVNFVINKIKHRQLYKKFKRPTNFDYNMMVIGGGAAGLVTSYISAAVKSRVALIERDKMGGDCLNTGCVPSKALIKSAKIIHLKNKSQNYGIKNIDINFDFLDVMNRVKEVVRSVGPHDSIERYKSLGVECFTNNAKILSPYEVKVGEKIYTTQNITIATGARPYIPPIPGIENSNYVTSDTLWDLTQLPPRFLIIGGGPIGCEMAQCFSRLGSKVTIVDIGPRILIKEDIEASVLIQKILEEEGVIIFSGHKALEFTQLDGTRILLCESNTKEKIKLEYDTVLIAVGRLANVQGFGLEELGVSIRKNGTIETNEFLETNYPNIFACGDVTGPYQLTHIAAHQAWYCAVNGLFGKFKKFKADYRGIPWCTFTEPEVATVGINEEAAKSSKLEYEVTLYHLNDLDRAIAEDETLGFVKVITQKGSDKILGATIVGNQASTMILEFITAIKFNIGMKKILATIHIYPSMGEANKYAAGEWSRAHAPQKIIKILEKYFSWTRR